MGKTDLTEEELIAGGMFLGFVAGAFVAGKLTRVVCKFKTRRGIKKGLKDYWDFNSKMNEINCQNCQCGMGMGMGAGMMNSDFSTGGMGAGMMGSNFNEGGMGMGSGFSKKHKKWFNR